MKYPVALIILLAGVQAVPAEAVAAMQKTILDLVQITAEGKLYTIQALSKPDETMSNFSTDVVVNVILEGASQPVATITPGEAGEPIIVTLEAVHIVPGDDRQFAINIHSGGNDIVASCSAAYYAIHGGKLELLLKVEWGDPQASDIDGDGVQEIVTQAEYWGQFLSHAECIPYLDAIYSFDGTKLVKKTADYRKYIELDKSALEQYEQARAHIQVQGIPYEGLRDEERQDLFRAAVAALLAYRNSWLREDAATWWQNNAEFLSHVLYAGNYNELQLVLEPEKGRLWNGEDYTLVR
jgi:hypothetical protein